MISENHLERARGPLATRCNFSSYSTFRCAKKQQAVVAHYKAIRTILYVSLIKVYAWAFDIKNNENLQYLINYIFMKIYVYN